MPRNRYTLIVVYMCSCVFIGILYMYRTAVLFGVCHAVVYAYIITAWAGFQLLILLKGQCESLHTGIGAERDLLPRLFCFHNLIAYVNGQQGSAGQAPLCVPLTQEDLKSIYNLHLLFTLLIKTFKL